MELPRIFVAFLSKGTESLATKRGRYRSVQVEFANGKHNMSDRPNYIVELTASR